MASNPVEAKGAIDAVPIDDRVRRAVVVGFTWTIGVAGVLWGTLYVLLGTPVAAAYPYGFAALSVVNALLNRKPERFGVFAAIEIGLILFVPSLLAVHLGGIGGSGGVVMWSALAPIGAVLVFRWRVAALVFGAFVVLGALAVAAPLWWPAREVLPPNAPAIFLFLNIVGVSLVVFWTVRTFVAKNAELQLQEQKLRVLEKAYLEQDIMLRQQERLATLGKLSAGVAHELNNPAAAAARASGQLSGIVRRLMEGAEALLEQNVGPDQVARVRALAPHDLDADPLACSDREDSLGAWFAERSVEDGWELAGILAEMGFEAKQIRSIASGDGAEQLPAILRWIADVERAERLLGEVHDSAGRISQIVAALKGYSHMDRSAYGPVEVRTGIENTLIILRSNLTGIEIGVDIPRDLRPVAGNAGELNQVWTNLIANAAEALGDGDGRTISIAAREDDACIVVEVVDNGPGIPEDLVPHIFDPFVTTKPPGEGTGLGLHLVHQTVVERHGGRIRVDSRPGRTSFEVRLPIRTEEKVDG